LRHRGDAGREAADETDEHVLHRRRAEILGRENLRVIGVERELGLVLLLFAEPVEALDLRLGKRAVFPCARCPPLELGRLGRALQRFPGSQQCIDVDAVVDRRLSHRNPLNCG
jgi:hypothetical protein